MKVTDSRCLESAQHSEPAALKRGRQQRFSQEALRLVSATMASFVATGLPARQDLSDKVAETFLEDERVAVLVIKIGDLGQINHSRGYEAGDAVLREVIGRIHDRHANVRFIGRLGGGHFLAIALAKGTLDHFRVTIEHLIADLSLPIELASGPVYVSCSIGASVAPDDTEMADDLLCNAEMALREALRGSYAFYHPGLKDELIDRMAVRSALAGAMERGEFSLAYQPQVCWQTGRVFGAEALLRWESESLGLVPPNRFISVAESAGLMPRIGHWVMIQACQQARRWLDAGRSLRVAVNVSAAQLEAGDFVGCVREALDQSRLPAHLLEIEVTESMLVRQACDNRDTLRAIRDLGVQLGLDDFGTGYSNLAYLRNFTFDTLKIDRLFVSALSEDNPADVLVRAIIAMGEELGQEVIAEGIETDLQKDALLKMGCTRMQGFLFGRPMPAWKLEQLLEAPSHWPLSGT